MSASNAAQDALWIERSERNVLLTLALVAAAEVCAFAWLFDCTGCPTHEPDVGTYGRA